MTCTKQLASRWIGTRCFIFSIETVILPNRKPACYSRAVVCERANKYSTARFNTSNN